VAAAWTQVLVWKNAPLLEGVAQAAPAGRLAGMPKRAAAVRVGQVMARLRFQPWRGPAPKRERGWGVTPKRVVELARTYGVATLLSEMGSPRS
jgi:hypothetical protein